MSADERLIDSLVRMVMPAGLPDDRVATSGPAARSWRSMVRASGSRRGTGLLLATGAVAALALAVSVVVLAVFRSVPKRLVCAAVVVAAQWFVFSTWYFGSPVPFSATQKLAGRAGESASDPTWFLRSITGREGVVVLLLVGRRVRSELWSFPLLRSEVAADAGTGPADQRWAIAALLSGLLWVGLHTVAYSLVDLGAPYPWYTAVVYPVLVLLSVSRAPAVGFTATTLAEGYQPRFQPGTGRHPPRGRPVLGYPCGAR